VSAEPGTNCRGEGDGYVVLDANGVGPALFVGGGGDVTLRHMTLMNGHNTGAGGNLEMYWGATAHLEDSNVVLGHSDSHGGGIFVAHEATLTLSGTSSVYWNDSDGHGGGIHSLGSVVLEDDARVGLGSGAVDFGNSAALDGGGIYAQGPLDIRDDSALLGNHAGGDGGGVFASGLADVSVTGDVGRVGSGGNDAERGGGLFISSGATLFVGGNSRIGGNEANADGGGVFAEGATLDLLGGAIEQNVAGGEGGGMFSTDSTVLLDTVWVDGNQAAQGGGVLQSGGILTGFLGEIRNNTAEADGGGLVLRNGAAATMVEARIAGNSAGGVGGGVLVEGASLTLDTLYPFACDHSVLEPDAWCSEVVENEAREGAGVHARDSGLVAVHRVGFRANHASTYGSAIMAKGAGTDLTLTNSHLLDQTEGVWPSAAVGVLSGAKAVVQLNTFADNGGYAAYFAPTTSGSFDGNLVWDNGGGVVLAGPLSSACNLTQGSALPGFQNVSEDPRFVTTARGRHRFDAGSVAADHCDTGMDIFGLDGSKRDLNMTDIGAYELF
jgi:predicted outer membrane repeat protein